MSAENDRVISFFADPQGQVRFQVMTRTQPLEFDGLEPLHWRKVYRSDPYPTSGAAFDAARELFSWIETSWREGLES